MRMTGAIVRDTRSMRDAAFFVDQAGNIQSA
jgi:hypothetical protein